MTKFTAWFAIVLSVCIFGCSEPVKPVVYVPAVNLDPGNFPSPSLNGSVIFWHDTFGVRLIERETGSNLTHAAIVIHGYVYEAVPPCVHKVPLATYKAELDKRGIKWFMARPKTPYTLHQVSMMYIHAESQLGRPYMIRGWWRGHEVAGIFCSQLVADVIECSGRIKSAGVRESPASLSKKLEPLYSDVPKG